MLLLMWGQPSDQLRLPATIEVLRDVEVTRPQEGDGILPDAHGYLSLSAPPNATPFRIARGQRFEMMKYLGNGACRIRFQKREYDVSDCYWTVGYSDMHTDVFRVLTRYLTESEAKKAPRVPSVN